MNSYNGFSPDQRNRAQAWLNKGWRDGALARPKICVACGQDEGVMDAHAEDYSEPFRPGVTDGFHLCFVCHMMVHCRHRNEKAWQTYRHFVEIGGRSAKAFKTRDFPGFANLFLNKPISPGLFRYFDPPARQALHEIELSQDQIRKAG
jgi:hypothetical protein